MPHSENDASQNCGVIARGEVSLIDATTIQFLSNLSRKYSKVWVLPEKSPNASLVCLDDIRYMFGQLACVSGVASCLEECPAGLDSVSFPGRALAGMENTLQAPDRTYEPVPKGYSEMEVLAERPYPLVLLSGCFDLIHPGHFRLIQSAARYTERPFVAALTTFGISVQPKNRGDRPLWTMADRLTVLQAHRARPHILLFDGPDSIALIERLQPDYFLKERHDRDRPIVREETRLVERLGGRVVWINVDKSLSSTRLASLIRLGAESRMH